MDIDKRLRRRVAEVLGVHETRVVESASLTRDLGMYSVTEADLAFAIESEYDLRSGWWRKESDTFGDLVHDVRCALDATRHQRFECGLRTLEQGNLPQRDLYVTPSATSAAHIVSIPNA